MPPYADDEGHAQLRTVGVVEGLEGGEFLFAETGQSVVGLWNLGVSLPFPPAFP